MSVAVWVYPRGRAFAACLDDERRDTMATDTDQIEERRKEVEALRSEVRRLSDRAQIFDALHRYSKGLDRLDKEILASAYYPDAWDNHGAWKGTPAEFVDWVYDLMQEWDHSLHILDLNNLEIDGDTAQSECYCLFTQRRTDGGGLDFGGARYLDTLERRDGEWRITKRKLVMDWTARAEAVEFADSATYPIGSRDRNDPS